MALPLCQWWRKRQINDEYTQGILIFRCRKLKFNRESLKLENPSKKFISICQNEKAFISGCVYSQPSLLCQPQNFSIFDSFHA